MKTTQSILTVIIGLTMAGCATTGSKSNPAQKTVYVETIVPLSARSGWSGAKNTCLDGIGKLKNLTWKEKLKVGNACVLSGQWASVETVGAFIAEKEHQSPWGPYYLSLAAEARSDFPRALWMIDLASKKAPNNGMMVYQAGRIHWKNGDRLSAKRSFEAAIKLASNLSEAHSILGQLALLDGNLSDAEKRFQKALQSDSRNQSSLLGLAEVKIKKKLYKEAIDLLGQAISNAPSSYQARVRQAYVFEVLDKNYPEALSAYRRIQTLDGNKRLDAAVDIDLESKIRSLEALVKNSVPNQVTLREQSNDKKVTK